MIGLMFEPNKYKKYKIIKIKDKYKRVIYTFYLIIIKDNQRFKTLFS